MRQYMGVVRIMTWHYVQFRFHHFGVRGVYAHNNSYTEGHINGGIVSLDHHKLINHPNDIANDVNDIIPAYTIPIIACRQG